MAKDKRRISSDYVYAALCMIIQLAFLPCFVLATVSWHLYVLIVLISLGLSAPSFVKAYTASVVEDKEAALGSQAVMESAGGLVSAVLLDAVQSSVGAEAVFVTAAILVGLGLFSLVVSLAVKI